MATFRSWLGACAALLAIGGLATVALAEGREQALAKGHADFGGPFTLTNAAGETVSDTDFRGKLVLVYFGYTSCLMQCPPSWLTMDHVISELRDEGAGDQIEAIFITIDPHRDDAAGMARWQENWNTITGLTGSVEQIHDVAAEYHIFYARKPDHALPFAMDDMKRVREEFGSDDRIKWDANKADGYYMMDHTMQTFLLDREGHYATHFEREEDPDTLISVIKEHL